MRRLLLASALVLAAPAGAHATTAQPLVDIAPTTTAFTDRLLPRTTAATARAARSASTAAFRTGDGRTVRVSFTRSYGLQRSVGQSYVDFLGSLPHGSELSRLRVLIATPSDVVSTCGGGADVLACYTPNTQLMIVPGEQRGDGGVSTSYVVAHEYGHHVAANRSNAPLDALDFGPKRWASRELVCNRTSRGVLFPGDEGQRYTLNPGENWAETFARLRYPERRWTFADALRPDAAALAAARSDVLTPWRSPRVKTFASSFTASSPATKRFSLPLRLDGALRVRLSGPADASYGLALSSNGVRRATAKGSGAGHAISFRVACRDRIVDDATAVVTRRAGKGPFTVRVTYAG